MTEDDWDRPPPSAPLPEPISGPPTPSTGIRWVGSIVVTVCLLMLAAIIIPALTAVHTEGGPPKDLEQVRGMGNAFTLYYKKYSYFPALVDMNDKTKVKSIADARIPGKECLALKLLMQGGFIEDAKCFFSPRDASPTQYTLDRMQKELDLNLDPAWATTYAYDPGHNPNHGAVPFFGNRLSMLTQGKHDTAYVLTCEQVAKEIEPTNGAWVFANHATGSAVLQTDDMFKDDSAVFTWRDADLFETNGELVP